MEVTNDCSCTICHQVFALPMTLHCGHTFCYECIHTNYVTHNNRTCPICREFVFQLPSNCNIILKAQIERHFENQPEDREAYQRRIENGETMMNAHRETRENSSRRHHRRHRRQTNIFRIPEVMATFDDFFPRLITSDSEEEEEENNREEEENNHGDGNEFISELHIALVPNALFQGPTSAPPNLSNLPFFTVPPPRPPPPPSSTTRRQNLARTLRRAEIEAQLTVLQQEDQRLERRQRRLQRRVRNPPNLIPHQHFISTSENFSQSPPNISAEIILQPNFLNTTYPPRMRRNRRENTNINNFNRVLSRALEELFMEQQQQNRNRVQNTSRVDANRLSPRPFFVSPSLNFGFSQQRQQQQQQQQRGAPNPTSTNPTQATFSRVLSQANDTPETVNTEEDLDLLLQQTIFNSLNQN